MPEPVARHCVQNIIEGDFEVPDKSTMSRFRLSFDCGWMLVMRMFNASSEGRLDWWSMPCRVMLADSSEQHGEDWLQLAYLQVASEDIVPVSNAVDRLQSSFRF